MIVRIAFAAVCVLAAMASPAAAQVPIVSPRYGAPPQPTELTVRLLAMARPTVVFLERSSELALTHAGSRRIRAAAPREVREQAAVEAELDAVAAPTIITGDPLDAAAVAAASIDEGTQTILSALPRILRTPGARAVAADRAIADRGAADLAALDALDGGAFDAAYVALRREALRRLASLYRDYIQNGDDQALRAVSVHALPRVLAQLAASRDR